MGKIHQVDRIQLSDDLRFTRNRGSPSGWAGDSSARSSIAADGGRTAARPLLARSGAGSSLLVDYDRFGNLKTEQSVDRAAPLPDPRTGGVVSLWIEQTSWTA
jgi:hypothetical protein